IGIMIAATPARAQTAMQHTGTVHIASDLERSIFGSLRCTCGSCPRDLLSTCGCETADEARENIRAKIRAGEARDQILAEYATEYGSEYLSVPPNQGMLKAIWAVPLAGIAVGSAGLVHLLRRWRKGDAAAATPPAPTPPARDAYDAQLDEELKNIDDRD
ncbi:MAG: cytochrome c-type biogenesis protein CcmH, partial [Polyangiaceae bacterium]